MNRLLAGALSLALLAGACSGSSTPTSPSTPSTPSTPSASAPVVTTYGGIVLLGTGEVGQVVFTVSVATAITASVGTARLTVAPRAFLVAGIPQAPQAATAGTGTVTGTLTLRSGVVAVTGTLSSTGMLSLQGSGVSLTGTIGSDGTVSASGTGSGGVTLGVIAGVAATSGPNKASLSNFTGTYTSKHTPPGKAGPVEMNTNTATMTIAATPSGPNQWPVRGQYLDSSNPVAQYLGWHGTVTLGQGDSPSTSIRTGTLNGTLDVQAITIQGSWGTVPGTTAGQWGGTFSGTSPDGGPTQGTFYLTAYCIPDAIIVVCPN